MKVGEGEEQGVQGLTTVAGYVMVKIVHLFYD